MYPKNQAVGGVGSSYGVGREIHTSSASFEIEHCTDEGRVLMREAIVLLSSPSTSLDVIQTREVASPRRFPGHLVEFTVLYHHGVNDSKETLIGREDAGASRQRVAFSRKSGIQYQEKLTDLEGSLDKYAR